MHTVELYRKVGLACRDGMSERAAARHFGISRESVKKMLCFSVPPGRRAIGGRPVTVTRGQEMPRVLPKTIPRTFRNVYWKKLPKNGNAAKMLS